MCLCSVYKGVHTDTQTQTHIQRKTYQNVNGVDLWAEELRVTLIFSFTLSLLPRFIFYNENKYF